MKSGSINKNILIYFVAERYIFPSENSRKKIKAFELLKEADDMLNMYVAWMFANLIVLQKKWQSRLMTMINYISTTMSSIILLAFIRG